MKRFFVSGLAILILSTEMHSQLCPGGGTTFSTSVTFLQSWTSGCSGTTNCTGGIVLDNRSSCEPSTAMDPCAPTPSGTVVADNGSDLWFKFYATGTTAAIHVKQSVSFMAAIQAFSGGPTCGALTEIGSIVASGISVGVILNLSSLTTGNAYYFRVFGSSSNSSQRTGTFCFCGSTGLGSVPLPVTLTSFKAIIEKNEVKLSWHTASELNNKYFEVQHSIDGNNFIAIGTIPGKGTTTLPSDYLFSHANPVAGVNYYRLKQIDIDDRYEYSDVITAKINYGNLTSLYPNPVKEKLIISSSVNTEANLLNEAGQKLQTINLGKGRNELGISKLQGSVYFIKFSDGSIQKFNVIK